MKKVLLIIATLFLLTACTPDESQFKSDVPTTRPSFENRVGEPIGEQIDEQIDQSAPQAALQSALPSEINLDVPFFPQAPDADWGMPWQEACEEAAVLLAYYYATDQSPTKEEFKKDVQKLVDWQIENFGSYEHTDIEQTAEMLRENFLNNQTDPEGGIRESRLRGSDLVILNNPTISELKSELAQGHAIVAPFAGRQLGNPFYTGEGPLYHMMVLKGYDETHFITNDVGTKRGHNFIYPYQTIMSAMHEWHDTDINSGAKKVIVLYNELL